MNILVVGDAPSSLNVDRNVAFLGARCMPTLLSWLAELSLGDLDHKYLINSHTIKLREVIRKHDGPIIALGNKAYARCIKFHDRKHVFKLPHPSGLNRQLNDKEYVAHQLRTCKAWMKMYEDRVHQ